VAHGPRNHETPVGTGVRQYRYRDSNYPSTRVQPLDLCVGVIAEHAPPTVPTGTVDGDLAAGR
jgi:hypothetical protein